MVRHIVYFLFICVVFFNLSGCAILQKGYDGLKNVTSSITTRIKNRKKESVVTSPREKKVEGKGYLSKNINMPQKMPTSDSNNVSISDSVLESSNNNKAKDLSKIELTTKVKELEGKLVEEKNEKDRALNELSAFKVEFQKEIFTLSNQVEQEKAKNRVLNEKMMESELSAMKAKQNLSDIKASLMLQRNIFQSNYPIFYEVQKGDSLWKIAGKKEIYNNFYNWLEIFHANKDKLEDKDLIYPGMVLSIPRYHEFLLSNFENSLDLNEEEIKKNKGGEFEEVNQEE